MTLQRVFIQKILDLMDAEKTLLLAEKVAALEAAGKILHGESIVTGRPLVDGNRGAV